MSGLRIEKVSEIKKTEGEKANIDSGDPTLRHQITCKKCGMVYEIRYIPEHCRKVDGEGYLCMNCNAVLDLS